MKWVNQEYVVPACPPSINTTVVQLHYTLLLEIEAPFGSSNPKLNIPIIIGSVPYRGQHQFQSKEIEASFPQQGSFDSVYFTHKCCKLIFKSFFW